jgi:hypothetical protein
MEEVDAGLDLAVHQTLATAERCGPSAITKTWRPSRAIGALLRF